MPIKIPNELPARATLEAEGVMLMREADAVRQDIRPMRIGLLNLMPNKIRTETQFARLLGASPLQVELTLVKMTNHVPRNTPSDHILSFYRDWQDVRPEKLFGVYRHRIIEAASPYLRGFSDDFTIPVSRWTENRREDIPAASGMKV